MARMAVLLGLLPWVTIAGCAAPRATVRSTEPLQKFKKVYMFMFEANADPRGVQPKVVSHLQSMGFEVVLLKKDQPLEPQGSGFIISRDGHILTCAHLVTDKKYATVWISGKRYEADIVNQDPQKDLAILKIKSPADVVPKPLPLTKSDKVSMGQDVFTMGFPMSRVLGNAPRLTKGLINSTVGLKDNPDQLQVSAEIQPGNSGSPLFNDQREVIGLMTSTLNPLNVMTKSGGLLPQNVNFALKAGPIRTFIEQSGFPQTLSGQIPNPSSFEEAKDSVVQVYGGIVPADKPPELVCTIYYQSFWDLWWRFRVFRIRFYDLETGKLLLEAGQYRDTVFTTEDVVLNRTLAEIRNKFLSE
jgi:S1-C subfamily serine protease